MFNDAAYFGQFVCIIIGLTVNYYKVWKDLCELHSIIFRYLSKIQKIDIKNIVG